MGTNVFLCLLNSNLCSECSKRKFSKIDEDFEKKFLREANELYGIQETGLQHGGKSFTAPMMKSILLATNKKLKDENIFRDDERKKRGNEIMSQLLQNFQWLELLFTSPELIGILSSEYQFYMDIEDDTRQEYIKLIEYEKDL